MALEVILPKVDMDMSSAVISRWHVKDGDTVRKDQTIFEIETDKAAMEIESPGDGIIRLADLGGARDIAVGTVVALVYADHESGRPPMTVSSVAADPPKAAQHPAQQAATITAPVRHSSTNTRATPLARSLARKSGIDLGRIAGSGPRGRIIAADVYAGPVSFSSAAVAQGGGTFHLSATCNAGRVLDLLQRFSARSSSTSDSQQARGVSFAAIAVKAFAQAITQIIMPGAEQRLASSAHRYSANIAVTMPKPAGTTAGLIQHADRKSISALSAEMEALGEAVALQDSRASSMAQEGAAVIDLSACGIESFAGTLNMPQPIVLTICAVTESVLPVDGRPQTVKSVSITLTCNGQYIDVSAGARLLASVKRTLEEPAFLLL